MISKSSINPRAVLLAGVLATAPALAQTTPVKSFDLEQVVLNPGGQHSLLLSTGDTLSEGELRLSLAAQYQHDPLVFVVNGVPQGSVIGHRLSGHLAAAYGLTDGVELALQLPVVLRQWGDDLTSQGIAPVSGTVFGAPVLQGRFALARQSSESFADVGLNLGLTLPFGGSSGLARDPGPGLSFNASAGFGHDFGSLFRVGAELGAVIRGRETLSRLSSTVRDEVGSYLTLGASASTLGKGLRGELTARTLVAFTQTSSAVELLAGARYPLPHGLEVFALAGPGFGRMPGNAEFRAFLGISLRPFPAREKAAPRTEVEPTPAPVCPPAPACPEAPACPACPEAQSCPPAPVCPPPPPPPPADTDHDGIPDAEDACPDQAGDAAHRGCPPPPPPAPTPAPPPKVELKSNRIELKDQVQFATGKSEILPGSFPLLEEVARILKEHPELKRLEINGHTDNRGARDYNIQLSQDRAEAVRRFLIERGVEPGRLSAKGYGPDQPIDTNDTAEGRQRNRRTEFIAIQ